MTHVPLAEQVVGPQMLPALQTRLAAHHRAAFVECLAQWGSGTHTVVRTGQLGKHLSEPTQTDLAYRHMPPVAAQDTPLHPPDALSVRWSSARGA